MGVEKSDILDRDASNMAVRVALGETQVIAETREFLASQGARNHWSRCFTGKRGQPEVG